MVPDACFFRCGFMEGDSRTVRGVVLLVAVAYFFFDLFATGGEAVAEAMLWFASASTGDVVSDFLEPKTVLVYKER